MNIVVLILIKMSKNDNAKSVKENPEDNDRLKHEHK